MTGVNAHTECPHCGASLLGERIPLEDQLKFGGATHFTRAIGVKIEGRVLLWQCPDCRRRWHRFPPGHDMRERAEPHLTPGEECRQ